jgi:hypothetical protein
MAGVGYSTTKEIRNEHKSRTENSLDSCLRSPEKKRRTNYHNVVYMDYFNEHISRKNLQDFYM